MMSQDTWYEMSEMTSPEFAAVAKDIEVALIPVGALEQHGGNLALATDYVVGHRLAQRLAARLHPRAIVVPPLPFGLSYHHAAFAGTITLSPETFTAVCIDVAKSLKKNGINHVIFVNGHNGNLAILNVITTKLRYEHDMRAATSFYFAQAADRVREHGKTPRFGHACEIETSVLLELAPELVRADGLEEGAMLPVKMKYAFNNQPFALQVPVPFEEQSTNGAFGDARLADVAVGRDIVTTALDRTVEFVEDFVKT
jgi:creatinine amidohydrolase